MPRQGGARPAKRRRRVDADFRRARRGGFAGCGFLEFGSWGLGGKGNGWDGDAEHAAERAQDAAELGSGGERGLHLRVVHMVDELAGAGGCDAAIADQPAEAALQPVRPGLRGGAGLRGRGRLGFRAGLADRETAQGAGGDADDDGVVLGGDAANAMADQRDHRRRHPLRMNPAALLRADDAQQQLDGQGETLGDIMDHPP